MNNEQLREKILELKNTKNAIILAHYYCSGEVQSVADFVGDSLALAVKAAESTAQTILFAGVSFMGQTAKVLCPDKTVLEVDPTAGCSLADSCPAPDFEKFLEKYPHHTVISYVNTTAEVKALSDICCTSSNAVAIVDSLPMDEKIVFGPDKNLGAYVRTQTGREDMVLWDGACHVHARFPVEGIRKLKAKFPDAKILVHPECPREIVELADCTGATSQLLKYSVEDTATTYIVATESGILYNMQLENPNKTFIAAPSDKCTCNECEFMKQNTLEKMVAALESGQNEVLMDSITIKKASRPIHKMIEISRSLNLV